MFCILFGFPVLTQVPGIACSNEGRLFEKLSTTRVQGPQPYGMSACGVSRSKRCQQKCDTQLSSVPPHAINSLRSSK
jgi:hypothetical protein